MNNIPSRPVFEADQVLTYQDLEYLIDVYKKAEIVYMNLGQTGKAKDCCVVHKVAESQLSWLERGKPKGERLI